MLCQWQYSCPECWTAGTPQSSQYALPWEVPRVSSSSFGNTAISPHPPFIPRDITDDHEPEDESSRQERSTIIPDAENDYIDIGDPDEIDEHEFLNTALLSHIAVKLRDKVPRGNHVKGSIPYRNAFTGKDIVSTIQSIIQRDLPDIARDNKRTALQIARSLQNQLFFYEVEWGDRQLSGGVEDVFMFLDEPNDDNSVGLGGITERDELPTGVITSLTRCYTVDCIDYEGPCYSYSCPKRNVRKPVGLSIDFEPMPDTAKRGWADNIDPVILKSLPVSEVKRQTVIARIISQEAQYVNDLDLIDTLFVKPLRAAPEPIVAPNELDSFIDTVFGNILDLRETNRRLLEVMYVRQREQGPIVQWIGDIFLNAAAEFRVVYPLYVGNLPAAEKRVKDESEYNPKFKVFLEHQARHPLARRMDLRRFITRPSEHLQRYPTLLEAIRNETVQGNPDADYLQEASESIRKLSTVAQLRTFQSSMGRGPAGRQEWHDLVSAEVQEHIPRKEFKRQSIIFELIKGEMEYVRDLELIEVLFLKPLRSTNLFSPSEHSERRSEELIHEIFHNHLEILSFHRKLIEVMHEIQREQYPCINSIIAPLYDASLNWQDAYIEYTSHYPIARFRVEEAMSNYAFKKVVDDALKHPEARKLDVKFFINRPIPRMLRYNLLLSSILSATPEGHPDQQDIPQVSELISALGKSMDHCVATAERKVELWRYKRNLRWKIGEEVDLDLLDETRTLVHTGRLLRQPEGGMEWNSWSELFVLLFDNYFVMTKPKEKDGVTLYYVNRRPIPLELLTVLSFREPPQHRSSSLLGFSRGGGRSGAHVDGGAVGAGDRGDAGDSRMLYPCSIHHAGRVGGHYHLFAESAAIRQEWEQKLSEAVVMRKVVQENNKAFEQRIISADTFLVPSIQAVPVQAYDGAITGKITCSVPLTAADGRPLVAVGCAEGVWIGLRHDSRSMRRVLHLKQVTQCAILEEFGIFLVLADKSLFAYHIEALVPSGPPGPQSQRQPQKLNGSRDVQFFSVGTWQDRTLVIYMKKKGLDSVFRILEPVTGKTAEKTKPTTFSRNIFGPKQLDWFRVYKEFFLPSDSFDLIFLKAKIAILCTKGFEIMDLADLKSITIPTSEDPRHSQLVKRCESCKPMGMFRSGDNEFLLCYDEFGLYVDRHGEPCRQYGGVVEWEGTAERVAFHPPNILIFDTRFIEIRQIDKGKLVQIIPGTDVHCVWDGRGSLVIPNPLTPGPQGWDERAPPEPRVHAVMKADQNPPNAPRGAQAQHLFELVPTQLLYPPSSHQSGGSLQHLADHLPQFVPLDPHQGGRVGHGNCCISLSSLNLSWIWRSGVFRNLGPFMFDPLTSNDVMYFDTAIPNHEKINPIESMNPNTMQSQQLDGGKNGNLQCICK
ncbi:Dbl-like domain-containing protein [Cantharellus anzutake]|uniref:Dbl-like domain-containing protein n=1 Tax=Cantharellus anzutake TaxID=1750568 RepID=UPI001907383F|nr:Dbl-like domain-containing protein [Cantharellus anzutake]KAF8329377.1 Dbl-like domain-containing protein [Cantharellus anzutake]